MRMLFVLILIVANALMVLESQAADVREKVRRAEAFQQCVDDCMAMTEPGFELKACIAECKKLYPVIDAEVLHPLFCETYEQCDEDERDPNDPGYDEPDDERDDNEEDDGGLS